MGLPRLEHGARLLCYINGAVIGAVTNYRFNSTTNRVPIRGIDLLYAQELAAATTEVSGTINLLRPIGIGGAQGIGLVAQASDIPLEKYVTILILDIVNDLPIFKCDLAQVTNESWDVSPKQLMAGTISFSGIAWTNEASNP